MLMDAVKLENESKSSELLNTDAEKLGDCLI